MFSESIREEMGQQRIEVYVERTLKSMRIVEVPAASYPEAQRVVEKLIKEKKFTGTDGWDVIKDDVTYSSEIPVFTWDDIVRKGG